MECNALVLYVVTHLLVHIMYSMWSLLGSSNFLNNYEVRTTKALKLVGISQLLLWT